jgi:inorganic pyrophosphatase
VRSGSQDQSVDVLVEIPKGSRAKYEMDQKTGRIRLEEPTFPGCVVPSRPIGTLLMREVRALADLGKHWLRGIETFFATYKELESNKSADVKGWHDADVAWKLIGDARARARQTP